jgi:hypothetical protein
MGGHHSQEVTDALLQRLEKIMIIIKLESDSTLGLKSHWLPEVSARVRPVFRVTWGAYLHLE